MKYRFLVFFHLISLIVSAQGFEAEVKKKLDSLNRLSRDLAGKKEYQQALEVNAVAIELIIEKGGKESEAYSSACYNRGRFFQHLDVFAEAEKWLLEAKTMQERVLGREHLTYAKTLTALGLFYKDYGQFEKAETFMLDAVAIRGRVQGKEHSDYAQLLNNLAIVYYYMGNYEKAEPLYLEAKSIQEKAVGKEHRLYVGVLLNLANLYMSKADYEKSESIYLESKAIYEKSLGKNNHDYAGLLLNLANLYRTMEIFDKAEPLYQKAKTLYEELKGKENDSYATILQNIGNLYSDLRNNEKAELFYLEAKTIREKVLGKENPDYAQSLGNLGILYHEMGNYKKAETYYLETKSIQERVLGKEHLEYTYTLGNLANLYQELGLFEKAEPFYFEAISTQEKVLDKKHPVYLMTLSNLANFYCLSGAKQKAGMIYKELASANQSLLQKAVRHLSEQELGNYLRQFSKFQDKFLSFVHGSATDTSLMPYCFDQSLFYKGFLLQASIQLKRLANFSPDASEKFSLLKSFERRLAYHYSQPIADRDSSAIATLESKTYNLEKELARSVSGYGAANLQVKWDEIHSALKPGEAAIEFVNYYYHQIDDYQVYQTDSMMYAALLITSSDKKVQFIPLFEEKSLSVDLLHKSEHTGSDHLIAEVYNRGAVPTKKVSLVGLYDVIWKPLDGLLKEVKTIYYSPSGLLHRINFDAIPVNATSNLSDHYKLVRLESTRPLAVPVLTEVDSTNQAFLFGGIDYNGQVSLSQQDSIRNEQIKAPKDQLEFSMVQRGINESAQEWTYLPGTEKEINNIAEIFNSSNFKPTVLSGKNGTEEAFKKIGTNNNPSPRILHIATHGYFFPDRTSSAKSRMTYDPDSIETASDPDKRSGAKAASTNIKKLQSESEPVFKISEHPMLRSGLILAGGNAAWTGKQTPSDREDGILTAYEISQMNLSNTELVVMSACETGLGDIQGNEGVYGLQRAFKIAGSKYLIMSLWQVPDKQTSLLMTTFYKKWLENKMTIPDAFRAAQKELRDFGLDPYQWAGFVLVE